MLDAFPIIETKLCHKILADMNLSNLLNLDKSDVVQEILLSLLEDQDQWMKLRNRSTSTTLMYVALKNKIINYIDAATTNSDLARHDPKHVIQEVRNQINNQYGNVWDTYCLLTEAEKDFVKSFYSKSNELTRADLKRVCRLTETQAARASRKVLRTARFDLTYRTLTSFDKETLNV